MIWLTQSSCATSPAPASCRGWCCEDVLRWSRGPRGRTCARVWVPQPSPLCAGAASHLPHPRADAGLSAQNPLLSGGENKKFDVNSRIHLEGFTISGMFFLVGSKIHLNLFFYKVHCQTGKHIFSLKYSRRTVCCAVFCCCFSLGLIIHIDIIKCRVFYFKTKWKNK